MRFFGLDTSDHLKILPVLWDQLKEKIPPGALNFPILIAATEKKHSIKLGLHAEKANFNFPTLFRSLTKTCSNLFREAGLDRFINHRVPIACQEYLLLQEILKKKWENEALCILWKRGIFPQLEEVLPLETPDEIRYWMNDPANRHYLLTISEIKISNKKMKAIPDEIAKLTELKYLDLSENAIVSIDSLSIPFVNENFDSQNFLLTA